MAAGAGAAALGGGASAAGTEGPVLEFRQYKIVPGRRDAMIELFEREFIEGQEMVGMRLIGQFRDLDDPDRFTWIRQFPSLPARADALNAFYFGPVWQAHRGAANAMLEDNDNVLLLRPAAADMNFADAERRTDGAGPGLVVATIHYLWKEPDTGFTRFFLDEIRPVLAQAGLPPIAAFVCERAANNFPRLPVREGEKLFLWFARVENAQAHARALEALSSSAGWRALEPRLKRFEERPPQLLRLGPTPRSRLR